MFDIGGRGSEVNRASIMKLEYNVTSSKKGKQKKKKNCDIQITKEVGGR